MKKLKDIKLVVFFALLVFIAVISIRNCIFFWDTAIKSREIFLGDYYYNFYLLYAILSLFSAIFSIILALVSLLELLYLNLPFLREKVVQIKEYFRKKKADSKVKKEELQRQQREKRKEELKKELEELENSDNI